MPIAAPHCLEGHVVCITGQYEYTTLIEHLGGTWQEDITEKTTMLIYEAEMKAGSKAGSKLREAHEQNAKAVMGKRGYKGEVPMGPIEIFSGADFIAWLEATATPKQRAAAVTQQKEKLAASVCLPFGKHANKPYEEIMKNDISYCNWVLKQPNTRGGMKAFQDWLKGRAKRVTCEACNGTGLGHLM